MRKEKKRNAFTFLTLTIVLFTLSGCLTAEKVDKFIASEFNNELPKPGKKRKTDIEVRPMSGIVSSSISTTEDKTDKFLPLLFYWKYDHRFNSSLNTAIPDTYFSNAVNAVSTKALSDKLNGRKLELTLQQVPSAFSLVVKENLIWVVYAFGWVRVYIEPDMKDLVVSYTLLEADKVLKTGTITVKNTEKKGDSRVFNAWRSATSEYLSEYNSNFTNMTKTLVNSLMQEL